jgi:hypothetical protein
LSSQCPESCGGWIHDDDFGVDGVIGYRSFGDLNMTFDLARRSLTLSRAPIGLRGAFELPCEMPLNVPTIPLVIAGKFGAVRSGSTPRTPLA